MISSLNKIEMFRQLPEAILGQVSAALQRRELTTGTLLFSQGDPGDELIIVESGKIAIFTPEENDQNKGQPIRLFGAGEVLGEMALIDQKPRSLSARAEEDSIIYTLGGENFLRLIQANPNMAITVMSGLNERIRYTTNFLNQVRIWVQRIASGDYKADEILQSSEQYQDKTLVSLAAEFAQMTSRVQEREEKLKQEVALLRIEVDDSKRKREVQEITSSDNFLKLKEKVKRLREQGNQ
jgi:CRP-like cAMP-binding protein